MEKSLGVIIPSRNRPDILLNLLTILSKFKKSSILEVLLSLDPDDDFGTIEKAIAFERKDSFFEYKVLSRPKRSYENKAANFALDNCESELFCWFPDSTIFHNKRWIEESIEKFYRLFPDKIGVLGFSIGGSGLGLSSKSFIKYNDNEFWHHGYKVHYADTELGMRSMMLGKAFNYDLGVKRNRNVIITHPAMSPTTRYLLIREDKKLFGERRIHNFYLDESRIVTSIEEIV